MGMWTDRSRAVIREILDVLPVGASQAEAKRALSEGYPFGLRENHPYKVWLKETKAALAKRFEGRDSSAGAKPKVAYVFLDRGRVWWLDVRCDWCSGTPLTSCLMCQ